MRAQRSSPGTNSYARHDDISAGTLQIGNGGTTGSLGGGAVSNAGALTFNRSNTVMVANAISGAGQVNQLGAGTTILTGANTYSGTTTISAGMLQVGNAGTTGALGTGAVINNAGLTFNRSNALTVSNAHQRHRRGDQRGRRNDHAHGRQHL